MRKMRVFYSSLQPRTKSLADRSPLDSHCTSQLKKKGTNGGWLSCLTRAMADTFDLFLLPTSLFFFFRWGRSPAGERSHVNVMKLSVSFRYHRCQKHHQNNFLTAFRLNLSARIPRKILILDLVAISANLSGHVLLMCLSCVRW